MRVYPSPVGVVPRHLVFAGLALAATGLGAQAAAQTTSRDVEVAARAVAFLASKPTGEQTTAVIYAPGNAESKADADAIVAILAGGVSANKVSLGAAKLVPVGDLSGLAGVQVAFVTRGLGAQHDGIAKAAASQHLLTVSSDLGCVRAGHCVVGVQGQPSVQILISKQASQATGQSFASAFLMMAKEL